MLDSFTVGNTTFSSRLLVGTGKYASYNLMRDALVASKSDIVTVALRRAGTTQSEEDILNYIPDRMHLLPNTSGARNADEAIRIARMARELGCGDLIKIEVIQDQMYLMPDNLETIRAAEVFIVFPYMSPNLMDAKRLVDAGASCIMPLASPIGSNRGLEAKGLIEILINSIDVPIIVDAGIGRPSDATIAMEMGASAVLVNTAIATSSNPVGMAEAFYYAVEAGRKAYLAKCAPKKSVGSASSPLTGFLRK